ncbi:helix-turn-helix transcriptional regulator [Xanthomonas campestris pv. raphani]|uniref:helix-turn-helix domain-containing protein n=1 Tax=Xanthomonas campestris TaxID=339 RepID=UPI002B3CBB6A|nr:helix-turn-helix transcriptional regulator [Xanthomonas campestris pv. raphani]
MDLASAFGVVLRDLRRRTGLTQEELGFEAGLERNFVSMLELGQRQPSLASVFKLARALGISAPQLVELVDKQLLAGDASPTASPG